MSFRKVLFLQPRQYFERLGVDFSVLPFEYDFGMPSFGIITSKYKKYDAVVTCIDHSHYLRLICRKFRAHGCCVVMIMDGVFEWSNATINPYLDRLRIKLLSPVFYDAVLAVDKGLTDVLTRSGVYARQYSLSNTTQAPEGRKEKYLITTANNPYFNHSEFEDLVGMIKSLVEYMEENHIPYDCRVYDQKLIDEVGISNDKNKLVGSFDEIIDEYSGVFSTPSTVVMSAMYKFIPVCILDYRDGPLFLQAGWRLRCPQGVSDVLVSMRSLNSDRMKFQIGQLSQSDINKELSNIDLGYFSECDLPYNINNLKLDPYSISFEYTARRILVYLKSSFSGLYKSLKRFVNEK